MLPKISSAGTATPARSAIRKARFETIVIDIPFSGGASPEA
jgi:hypothetical protein